MLLRLFKSKNPLILAFILILTVVFWVESFLEMPDIVQSGSEMPLYRLTLHWFKKPVFRIITALLLVISQSIFLLRFNTRFKILHENYFLHLLIFNLIIAGVPEILNMYPVYFGNFLFMYAVFRIFESVNTDNAIPHYFEAGFFISIASLFYFNFILFLFIAWIGLLIIRPVIWREWVVSIVGALLPFLFTFTYYFVFVDASYRWFFSHFNQMKFGYETISINPFTLILISLTGFTALLQVLKKKSLTVLNRKIRILLIWISLLSFAVYFFINNHSLQTIVIFSFGTSLFITNYLHELKRFWVGDVILFSLLGIIIYRHFFV